MSELNTTVGIDEQNDTNIQNTSLSDVDDDPGTSSHYRLVALPVGLFALLENLVIIIMLLSVRRLRHSAHVFFVLCLSFSDLLFSFSITVLAVIPFVFDQHNTLFCCFQHIMLHISFSTSLIVTFLICLERFKSIHGNISNVLYFNEKKSSIVILAWVLSVLYMSVLFLVVSLNQQEPMIPVTQCKIDIIFINGNEKIIYASLSAFYVPIFLLILPFYATTAIMIRQRLSRTFFENNVLKVSTIHDKVGMSTRTDNSDTACNHHRLKKLTTSGKKGGKLTTSKIGRSSYEDISKTRVNIPAKKAVTVLESVPTTSRDLASSFDHSVTRMIKHNKLKSTTRSRHMNKALLTVTLIVATYVICLGPVIITLFIRCFSTINQAVSHLTNTLGCLTAVMNPMLYVWRFPNLRKELKLKCSKIR